MESKSLKKRFPMLTYPINRCQKTPLFDGQIFTKTTVRWLLENAHKPGPGINKYQHRATNGPRL